MTIDEIITSIIKTAESDREKADDEWKHNDFVREAYIKHAEEHEKTAKLLEELKAYRSIGTQEECRSALEKQKAKKPKEYEDKFYACPMCGNALMQKWEKYPTKLMDKKNGLPYCLGCGQELDWSDEEC